jgi:Flp pilus assembly protein TadD
VAAFRKAIELQPHYAMAYLTLGNALLKQGQLAEAADAYRKAIELQPNFAKAYNNLGNALVYQGKLTEAEAALRKAIELLPDYALAHIALGNAMSKQGKLAEAEAALRKASELEPNNAVAHYDLGNILAYQGKLAEAEAAFRKAIMLKPDLAEAHCNLGQVLSRQGKFAKALAALRQGHELGTRQSSWHYPNSSQWVRQAERAAELDAKLSQILNGHTQPANSAECLELAQLCRVYRHLPVAAVRFYEQAFADQPALANDVQQHHRYTAAYVATQAAAGQGQDACQLGAEERTHLRHQALTWLRNDLRAWGQQLEQHPDQTRPRVVEAMHHWQRDPVFAGLRGPEALGRLPVAERREWQTLWEDVAALLRRADAP